MELSKLYMISLFKEYAYVDKIEIDKILKKELSLTETYIEIEKLIKKPYN